MSSLRKELRPGERLLWSAVPRPDGFRRRVRMITRFGKVFGGFAVVWMVLAATMMWVVPALLGEPMKTDDGEEIPVLLKVGFPLFGTPFLLVGVWLSRAGSREAERAGRTAYAITDQRAIIWESDRKGEVHCLSLAGSELANPTRLELGDGSGDLAFSSAKQRSGTVRGQVNGVPVSTLGFFGVENVREVERLLEELGSGSSGG